MVRSIVSPSMRRALQKQDLGSQYEERRERRWRRVLVLQGESRHSILKGTERQAVRDLRRFRAVALHSRWRADCVAQVQRSTRMPSENAASTRPSAIPQGALAVVEISGKRIALANVDGVFYAFADACTHEQCSLAEGGLEGTKVVCPCHGAEFDVRTGEVLAPPAKAPLRVYAVRVANDAIEIDV
jgi:3-phenylpropionate/trans-cinnamate dioxygenase ferredoxin subunit